jgi:Na+-transporting methylmalonyl-CoA/oxaloacetate decarboxylase gamma subunit
MLHEIANQPLSLGYSLLVSFIGILMVFLELIILAGMIKISSAVLRAVTAKKDTPKAASAPAPAAPAAAPAPAAEPAFIAAPPLVLADVDAPSAAAVMAIVSEKTGIPLNHLAFHSIKGQIAMQGVDDREAAVIMALTANQLGKPVNKLIFKSIKEI